MLTIVNHYVKVGGNELLSVDAYRTVKEARKSLIESGYKALNSSIGELFGKLDDDIMDIASLAKVPYSSSKKKKGHVTFVKGKKKKKFFDELPLFENEPVLIG